MRQSRAKETAVNAEPSLADRLPLLERVQHARDSMRNSERKVADVALADPASFVESTMAEIARAAEVSEPTVMRFACGLGYSGFHAFKLDLARALGVGAPLTDSGIQPDDSISMIAQRIFNHTLSSLDRFRKTIEPEVLEEAVDAILKARRVVFIGFGASHIIAEDAVQKADLFGVPCSAPEDLHQQLIVASMCSEQDVFVIISNTGTATSVEIAEVARSHGAFVIGITGSDDTPIVPKSDILLVARTYEDTNTFTPTVSRLAGLVIVDILSTAVAARRGEEHLRRIRQMKAELSQFRRQGSISELTNKRSND